MDNIKISKVIFSITFEDKNNHINKQKKVDRSVIEKLKLSL